MPAVDDEPNATTLIASPRCSFFATRGSLLVLLRRSCGTAQEDWAASVSDRAGRAARPNASAHAAATRARRITPLGSWTRSLRRFILSALSPVPYNTLTDLSIFINLLLGRDAAQNLDREQMPNPAIDLICRLASLAAAAAGKTKTIGIGPIFHDSEAREARHAAHAGNLLDRGHVGRKIDQLRRLPRELRVHQDDIGAGGKQPVDAGEPRLDEFLALPPPHHPCRPRLPAPPL